jgi:hypothetical protein
MSNILNSNVWISKSLSMPSNPIEPCDIKHGIIVTKAINGDIEGILNVSPNAMEVFNEGNV